LNNPGGTVTDGTDINVRTIAIIGGTGKEGKGLAYRWGKIGYEIIIGSRQIEKAEDAAAFVRNLPGMTGTVTGAANMTLLKRLIYSFSLFHLLPTFRCLNRSKTQLREKF
jgi:short-subunit dehydrogenase involved in D-alanine esterification of teichoic acids